MATLQEMFTSRDFRSQSLDGQREMYSAVDQDFAKLKPEEQDRILADVEDQFGRTAYEGEFDEAFKRGAAKSAAYFAHVGRNAVDMADFGDVARESVALDAQSDLEKYLIAQEDEWNEASINPEGKNTNWEVAGEMVGGALVAIPTFAALIGASTAALSAAGVPPPIAAGLATVGVAGFGVGALGAADQGFLEAMKAGTAQAAFMALFPGLKMLKLGPTTQAGIFGTVAYNMTPEDMELNERVGHGVTASLLGAVNGYHTKRSISKVNRPTVESETVRDQQKSVTLEVLEPEIAAKIYAEETISGLMQKRGREMAEREQIANDRLTYPKDPAEAAAMEKKISELPPEERAMVEEARQAELEADATRSTEIAERVQYLKFQHAKNTDPAQKAFIQKEIEFLQKQPELEPKIAETPESVKPTLAVKIGDKVIEAEGSESTHLEIASRAVGVDLNGRALGDLTGEELRSIGKADTGFMVDGEFKTKYPKAPSPREEVGGQGDLPAETARGRATEGAPEEPLKLAEGDTGKGFRGEESTFRGEFESRFGKMGEFGNEQLPPGGGGAGEGGVPAEPAAPVIHRSTKGDRKRWAYLDDGHGAMWMMRKAGLEDAPDNVYHHFQALRGIPDMQDGMVKYGVPKWITDPKIPGRKIIRFEPTTAYKAIEHRPGDPGYPDVSGYEEGSAPEVFYEAVPDGDLVHAGMADILLPAMGRGRKYESDSWDYFQARRSNELITQTIDHRTGRIRPSTMEEILALKTREKNWDLDKIAENLAKVNPERVAVFEGMKAYMRAMADFYVETGFVPRSQRDAWALNNMEYAFGFQRQREISKSGRHRTTDGIAKAMGIHKLHGSKKDVGDRYTNFIEGAQNLAGAALQNKWAADTVALADRLGGFMEKVSPRADRIVLGRQQLRRALKDEMMENEGLTEEQAQARMRWIGEMPGDIERLAFFVGANRPYGSDIISFIGADGKPQYRRVYDQVLLRTFDSMNRGAIEGMAGRWMANFKRFKQMMITMDPTFIASNFVRDPTMGSMMTRTGNQHFTAAINGYIHLMKNSQEYQDFVANGGGGSTVRDGVRLTRKRIIKHAERQNRAFLNPKNLIYTPADAWRFLQQIGRAVETAPRVGEYLRARETGLKGPRQGQPATMQESIFAGKEVSTNFSVRGGGKPTEFDGTFGDKYGPGMYKFLVDTAPFFSAMSASSDRGYRAVFRDPNGKFGSAVKIGMVAVSSMVLQALNVWMSKKYGHLKDEDGRTMVDFLNLPDWQKMTNWNFYFPDRYDAETGEPVHFLHFHMPKIWEVGMIGSLAERFAQSMMDGSEDDKNIFRDMLSILAHNFQIKTEGKGIPFPLPAGIDVAMEQAMNQILFTGQPIETRGMGEMSPWARGRSGTPRTLQEFSKTMRGPGNEWIPDIVQSPSRAEALLRGVFGNWANIGLQVTDQMFFPGGPALGWDDVPMIRRFYSEAGKYDENTEIYYRNLEKFNQAHGDYREMGKRGEREIQDEMYEDADQSAMMALAPGFDRLNLRLQKYNREIDMLKRGVAEPHATPKERHHMINKLEAERNAIMKYQNEMAKFFQKMAKDAEKGSAQVGDFGGPRTKGMSREDKVRELQRTAQ